MSEDNRRKDYRADLRTVVNVYTAESRRATPPHFLRAWSQDVSATGARLSTIEPLDGERVWLRFVGQGQNDCIVEADVVRTEAIPPSPFRTNPILNSYGVRFRRILSDAEFLELSLDEVERVTAGVNSSPTLLARSVG